MKDQSKSKTELIGELETLRKHIVKLKKVETKRKRAEDSLWESQACFHTVFEKSATGIGLTDLGGRLLNANPAFLQMLGYTGKELTGKSFLEFTHPDDLEKERESFRQLKQGGSNSLRMKKRYIRKDGQLVWANLTTSLFRNDKGVPQFVIGMVEDITERKRAAEVLRESEEKYRDVYNYAPLGLVVWDKDCCILEWNEQAEVMFGWSHDEAVGTNFFDLIISGKGRQRVEGIIEELMRGRIQRHIIHENVMKNGKPIWCEWNNAVLRDNEGRIVGAISLALDITERKRTEKEIHTYQEQLRALSSELSLIEERERRHIATDLHDHIGHTLALTKIKLGALREIVSPSGHISPIDEIQSLIDQAIHYTRSLTSELSPPVLYELGFEAAVEWLTEQIQDQHHIQVDFEDDRQSKPMDDEIRISLFKAVRELLINVAKHSKADKAKVSTRREDNIIRIIVEDDGVGFSIPEDKSLAKIGGFGLFSIHERLKYLKGDFEVESKPGQGTRITLVAPLTKEENKNRSVT